MRRRAGRKPSEGDPSISTSSGEQSYIDSEDELSSTRAMDGNDRDDEGSLLLEAGKGKNRHKRRPMLGFVLLIIGVSLITLIIFYFIKVSQGNCSDHFRKTRGSWSLRWSRSIDGPNSTIPKASDNASLDISSPLATNPSEHGTIGPNAYKGIDHYKRMDAQCSVVPTFPEDRRGNRNILKIANFNTEWLYLYGGRGGIKCPAQSCPWADELEAEEHLRRVARQIASIDADIVNLNEIEDCRVLAALLDLLPAGHGYKAFLTLSKDHATGQSTALLTRVDPHIDVVRSNRRTKYPVGESCCDWIKVGSVGVTKHHVAHINVGDAQGRNYPFVFIGVHLLARPTDKRRCCQREGQAVVLRDLAREVTTSSLAAGPTVPKYPVILGDFNDYDEDALGLDKKLPISAALKILHDGGKFMNAASLIPIKKRYSCWFDANQNCQLDGEAERVMIDHILLPRSLEAAILNVQVHHDYIPSCADRVSDHWPISLTLNLTAIPDLMITHPSHSHPDREANGSYQDGDDSFGPNPAVGGVNPDPN